MQDISLCLPVRLCILCYCSEWVWVCVFCVCVFYIMIFTVKILYFHMK